MNIVLQMFRILSVFCIVTIFVGFASVLHAKPSSEALIEAPLVVVELFTSQGCASCPPADAILTELSQKDDILALSYFVDYWNYLGWEDTFAGKDCTIRQKKYSRALGKSGVYTPQMIVQGTSDIVGSRGKQIHEMVGSTRQKIALTAKDAPRITFDPMGDMIDLKVSAGKPSGSRPKNATIWIIGYDYEKSVDIKWGEQGGNVRHYRNVVQSIKRIGSWMGEEIKLTLSKKDIGAVPYDAYAVILQEDETGPIVAAAKLTLK
ncbi:DUF1223 domain-containing protein [Paremcibacter congregatus]|uniref:DUF1223 domain-containing protein n=1 Tax=Paremcibacter congregatus TaxID=2043170 RepID=UPI003A94EBBA